MPQNIAHAAKRIRVDIGIGANPLSDSEITLDQAIPLAHDRVERDGAFADALFIAAVGRGAAALTLTKPGAAGPPSYFSLATRRHAK